MRIFDGAVLQVQDGSFVAIVSVARPSPYIFRRGLEIYSRFAMAAQGGIVLAAPPGWDPEAMRASALARLQVCARVPRNISLRVSLNKVVPFV